MQGLAFRCSFWAARRFSNHDSTSERPWYESLAHRKRRTVHQMIHDVREFSLFFDVAGDDLEPRDTRLHMA